jgi:hypothetical protein
MKARIGDPSGCLLLVSIPEELVISPEVSLNTVNLFRRDVSPAGMAAEFWKHRYPTGFRIRNDSNGNAY